MYRRHALIVRCYNVGTRFMRHTKCSKGRLWYGYKRQATYLQRVEVGSVAAHRGEDSVASRIVEAAEFLRCHHQIGQGMFESSYVHLSST